MEDLFRRVADRQTLGSVMQELRVNLGEVERHTDEYFRDPSQRQHLIPVPGQLQAMRGVFTVLGLDQAAVTCVRMRDEVDRLSNTEVDASLPGPRAIFERLATNLGQLGFLIDMLSVQAPLAKSMFKFDEEKGELVASVERERREAPAVPSLEAKLRAAVAAPASDPQAMARDLERLALQAAAEDRPALAAATQNVVRQLEAAPPQPLAFADLELPSLDLPPFSHALTEPMPLSEPMPLDAPNEAAMAAPVAAATAELQALLDSQLPAEPPAPPPSAALPTNEEELDEEMLEIFLEEANEVIANARAALDLLAEQPADKAQLTNVRRAFHTLKGSSRMVGLNAFGEGAWACEQLYNARLGDEKPADRQLLAFSTEALDELALWRDDIAAGDAALRSPQGLRDRADALRLGQPLPAAVPVAAPVAVDPLPEPVVEPLVEAIAEAAPELPAEPDLVLDLEMPATPATIEAPEPLDTLTLTLDLEALAPAEPDVDEIEFELPVENLAETHSDFEATQPLDAEPDTVLPEPVEPEVALVHLDFEAEPAAPLPPPAEDEGFRHRPQPARAGAAGAGRGAARARSATRSGRGRASARSRRGDRAGGAARPGLGHRPARGDCRAPTRTRGRRRATEPAEAAMVQIGELRISEALHRIFSAEAEELAQRLLAALRDWAPLHDEPPPANTEVYAHALAGNAATVGFAGLSALARALEHALGRAQQADRIGASDADCFLQAAQAIQQLLDRFGAGELQEADPTLIELLQLYEPEHRADGEDSQVAELAPVAAPVAALEAAIDDDFVPGEPDNIDAELWEIFEEEAGELLHQLHGRLRDWTSHPQDAARGDACMRTLHTFKGGARLAGAMHLGELAHRLESDVLNLLAQGARNAADLHPLQDRGDELEARFEALRQEQRAPTPAAPAPVEPVVAQEPVAAPVVAEAPPEPLTPPVAAQPIYLPEPVPVPVRLRDPAEVRWDRFSGIEARELTVADAAPLVSGQSLVRVRAALLDRLASQAGEVSIRRARMENELTQMKTALLELDDNLERLRTQLRELEVQAEAQISSRQEAARATGSDFDPLEFDRYTRFQEVTRMLAESVNDVATVQRSLQRNVAAGEDELAAQSRLTRELQDDLLRSRMVEFESIGERLHRVVRQAARESGKQVNLEIQGQGIELDRGVLERLIGAFEHLLRNSVVHGIEAPEQRKSAGKPELGTIRIKLSQEGNQVLIAFSDDGAGLDLARIRDKAQRQGLIADGHSPSDAELIQMIYAPGFSTASTVTEMAGRGVGMDVVRAEVTTLGGYVLTRTQSGKGSEFDLRVPLTTALTQVVILRCGELQVAVPASLVDTVLRLPNAELRQGLRDRPAAGRRWRRQGAGADLLAGRPAGPHRPPDPARQACGGGAGAFGPGPHRHPRRRGDRQPGSGGQEPRAAAHPCAGSGGHQPVGQRRGGPDLQPGGLGRTLWRGGHRAGPCRRCRGHRPGGRDGAAGAADPGRRRLADRASRDPALPRARGLPRAAGQGRPGCDGATGPRGIAGDGALRHRDAAHGRLRFGPQHPRRRPPAGPAGGHDHLAHRRQAPRIRGPAGCPGLPRQTL